MQRIDQFPFTTVEEAEMSAEQAVSFAADGNRLEGAIAIPGHSTQGFVMCHPHPQYGGTMDNSVVRTVIIYLQRAGIATLRFNFRGVGRSEGSYGNMIGEAADTRAAVALLREQSGVANVALAGYSFGAIVALRVGHDWSAADRLIAIAPPLSMFDTDFLRSCVKRKLFLIGDRDQFCPYEIFQQTVQSLPDPKASIGLPGADHFFFGFENEIGANVVQFMLESPCQPE